MTRGERVEFSDLFGIAPDFTGELSTEHYLALQRVNEETMREITESYWRNKIAGEIDESICVDNLDSPTQLAINEVLHRLAEDLRSGAIAIARGGGE